MHCTVLVPSPKPHHHHLFRPTGNHVFTQTHAQPVTLAVAASATPPTTTISFLSFNPVRGLLSSIASLFPSLRHQNGIFMENETIEDEDEIHPYAFHVSGPRNVPSPNWTQLFTSSWKDENYRRTVIACFIQAVYLLELDRQENRTEKTSLALNWWKPFKYKVIRKLVDKRDGSIFGALFEWDQSAALSNFILMRPSGAPRAVLALRGTFLTNPTIRRDIEDDLRFVAWESLEGSVRFSTTLEALKFAVDSCGSSNVCVGGHSLGAGFALQVGNMLAKEGIFVESHLFNPPSVSLAMSLRTIGDNVGFIWMRFKSMLPFSVGSRANHEEMPPSGGKRRGRWIPHLYVNNNDYICCYYGAPTEASNVDANAVVASNGEPSECSCEEVAAKLFVMSKAKQRFLEAHGLEQWWSEDLKLESVHNSKLISRQLESVYTLQSSSSPPDEKYLVPLTKKTINLFSGFLAGWLSIKFSNLRRILWCVSNISDD